MKQRLDLHECEGCGTVHDFAFRCYTCKQSSVPVTFVRQQRTDTATGAGVPSGKSARGGRPAPSRGPGL